MRTYALTHALIVFMGLATGCQASGTSNMQQGDRLDSVQPNQKSKSVTEGARFDALHRLALPSKQRTPTDCVATVSHACIPAVALRDAVAPLIGKVQLRQRLPSEAEVFRRCERELESLIEDRQLRFALRDDGLSLDRNAVDEKLRQRSYGTMLPELTFQARGEDADGIQREIARNVALYQLAEHRGRLTVLEKDIVARYEQIKFSTDSANIRAHISHILVEPEVKSLDENGFKVPYRLRRAAQRKARARALEIYRLALAPGSSFAELAKTYSDDPSARFGGELGIFEPRKGLIAAFSDVAFSLREGEVSKPVRTRFGHHLIYVTETFEPGLLPLKSLEKNIEKELIAEKFRHARTQLRAEMNQKYQSVRYGQRVDRVCRDALQKMM